MLSEVFWTFVVSSIAGCGLATLRMAYKSKCKHISCCGFSVDRDTAEESKVDISVPPSPSISRTDSMIRV